ncbi:MAG: sigma-70 family RNA polymerase sigma factor [Ktedonobacteraceae bacterium]|nr:sigma-70 family RNA polymerase sigma factor [Ktedonobacteraceae bacterium]
MQQLSVIEQTSSNTKRGQHIPATIAESDAERRNSANRMADGVLAQQALAGDERGFEQLVYRYNKPLFTFIYRHLRNREQSNDVLQKVFLRFYLSLPELNLNQPFGPWLFQVAYHYCVDEFRSRQRRPTIYFSEIFSLTSENELSPLDVLPDTGSLPEEVAEDHDLHQQFMQALQVLPAHYRSIVLLRYVAQLKFSEISQILDLPVATAKTYFHRAKPQLRRALEKSLS